MTEIVLMVLKQSHTILYSNSTVITIKLWHPSFT